MTLVASNIVTETLVPENRRMGFYMKHFLRAGFVTCELRYTHLMRMLCAEYTGGYWEFVELSNGGFFVYPRIVGDLDLVWSGNFFEGKASAKVAGIIVTIFTLSSYYDLPDPDHYVIKAELLKDYVSQLPEDIVSLIYQAID